MSSLNTQERIELKNLISKMDSDDNTENIKKLKHSPLIEKDVSTLEKLKKDEKVLRQEDNEKFIELCRVKCTFLFNSYTDIFNKIVKDEIDIQILIKFLKVLKMIEDNKVDQHEGSAIIGKLLKELYIDSAIRTGEHLDAKYASDKVGPNEGKTISWKEYKKGGPRSPLTPS